MTKKWSVRPPEGVNASLAWSAQENIRESLHPADAPNPIVWCERCKRHHRQHTFTQRDYDTVTGEGAQKIADAIDAEAMASARRALPKLSTSRIVGAK